MSDTTGPRKIAEQCGTCRYYRLVTSAPYYSSCQDEQEAPGTDYGRPDGWPLTETTDKCYRWCRADSGAPGDREGKPNEH